ncbi:L,D-transpeptidase [Paenibacillus hunanensis]|uniref:L,D-transpeptidase family protein n=1 Tax=Paenibacillus hunanensis TaxID=539262 RepID=UPI002026EA09|nr:L,D-transpeptidase family protein [Paenibacillus hunanensis]MCL9662177.1 L,D-transpeptidase [Paenibacillus hunanensis]
MNYHIMASFPTNRDKKGTLKMYNNTGALVFGPVEALGRGSNDPANNNDHTNWRLKNADVPTGQYQTVVVDPGSSSYSFGPNKRVWFNKALSGNAVTAESNGRSEIMIHGGDPATDSSLSWYPLRPTYGCIRLSNANQSALIAAIAKAGGGTGQVTISNQ